MSVRTSPAAAALAIALLGGGCAAPTAEPGESLAELRARGQPGAKRQATPGARARAVEQAWQDVVAGQADRHTTREALKSILWRAGEPQPARLAAARALLADHTPEGVRDTINLVNLRLPTETDMEVIAALGLGAAERGWPDVTPGLVRSWARPVLEPPDAERPERRALQRLHPERPVAEVVFDVFMRPGQGRFAERTRQDAWELLARLDADGTARAALLEGAQGDDPLVADLRAAARELGVVPRTALELRWLSGLRAPGHGGWWSETAGVVAGLGPEARRGLRLRHLEPVRWAAAHRPAWVAASRAVLLRQALGRLADRPHVARSEGVAEAPRRDERLEKWAAELSWGDLLSILVVDEALADPRVVEELFRQVETDRNDTSTEHGGILEMAGDGSARVRAFTPRPAQRAGDDRFIAPEDMFQESGTALAHYHFHVQATSRREHAGPGQGDMDYAQRTGRTCLVFTAVGARTLNADWYVSEGAIVDLGPLRLAGTASRAGR
ncbi:MAG TPA: hypothetical protein VD963_11590 [Phycisphaerales bacterium]|nr:hypothetical protein [Phycisphaerales bacterium]